MVEPTPSARTTPPPARTIALGLLALVGVIVVGLAWPTGGSHGRTGPPLAVTGWAPYWQPEASLASFQANADLFDDVAMVTHHVAPDLTVTRYPGVTDATIASFRSTADAAGVALLATVFDDSATGAMAATLADPTRRAAHIADLVRLVTDGGFDGLDLDYEGFAFRDSRATWATTRPLWIVFLGELDQALAVAAPRARLVASIPPVYDGGQTDASGYWVYDPAAMAGIVDRIRVMTYDYSISTSRPGPVAPLPWVQRVVTAMTDLVPPDRLDLGVPVYGYDWVVSVAGTCPPDQTPSTQVRSMATIQRIAGERALVPIWDEAAQEATLDYVDTLSGATADGTPASCTVQRSVHFLDGRAVFARAHVANDANLHGVTLWALGYDHPDAWTALRAARRGDDHLPVG